MAKKVKIPSLRDMQKKFPGFTIASEADDTSSPWLPSRFHALNYILGGGIPYGKVLELFGSESGGKYCANYEPILTNKGWKTHGTITTEDMVIDPVTGLPTEVLKVFPKGMRDIYRVTFKNGAHVDAGAEHLWEVWFKSHGKKVSKVVTTEELMKDYRKLRASNKGKYRYKYQIITTKPINLPTKALPIHPYILGFILGDGSIVDSSSNAVRFTISTVDAQETLDRLNSYLDSNKGQYIKEVTLDETTLRFRLYGFKNGLKELGLWGKDSKTKFIPSQYLYSSIDQRKELLAGLVDTDGSTCLQDKEAAHTNIKYTTHSYQLSEDMKFLVNSLGGLVYIKQGTHRNELENILHFRLNFNPFHRGYRKKALDYQINKASYQVDLMNTLVDIKYIGQHECTCIKVNTQRGLYITRDFIVTHNTLMAYDFAYCCQYLGGVVLWADAEQSFTNTWAETNGLDLSRVVVYRETAIEKISDWIASMALYWRSQLTHNEPILLVLDSVSALDTEANINSEMSDAKADMGNRAKAIYKYFRIRNEMLYSLGITQIYINQLRTNLKAGMFENPDTTPGGAALKFYASQRIGLYGGKTLTQKIKGKERKVGKVTSIRTMKNKVAPPRFTIKASPLYNNPKYNEVGFDKLHFLDEVLIEEEVIEKSNGGVYKLGDQVIARGEEKFKKVLAENDELRRKLLRKAGINTLGATKKKLEKLTTNLYPIDEAVGSEDFEEDEDE